MKLSGQRRYNQTLDRVSVTWDARHKEEVTGKQQGPSLPGRIEEHTCEERKLRRDFSRR